MGDRGERSDDPRNAEAAPPRFGILGPLVVLSPDGAQLPLGGRRPRELLAALLLHPNLLLSSDRLVTTIWGEAATDGAATTLRTHVATVRRVLKEAGSDDALTTGAGGYALAVDPLDVDAERFERLVHRGQEALALAQPEEAERLLDQALSWWRGDPLMDLGPPDFATATVTRLGELKLVAEESLTAAKIASGRHAEVIGRLQELTAANPFREGLAAQLMLALYRSGRQADALTTYAETRDRLADELGLDPGPELQELETAILRHDPALLPDAPAAVRGPRDDGGRRLREPLDAVYAALQRRPVVGRAAALSVLHEAWDEGSVRAGGFVTVSGPAGVGKSRLVADLAHRANTEGGTVLVGRCDERVPFAALTSALSGSPTVLDVVSSAPEGVRARLRPLLPWDLGSHDDAGAGEAGARPAAGEAPGDRQGVVRAVAWLLDALAARTPVLLVVEDGERLDDATGELLAHLVTRLPTSTVIALCYRDPPGTRHPPLADLLARSGVRELTGRVVLEPLDREAIRQLVAVATDTPQDLVSDDLVAAVWDRTGGNPFFAIELVRDLGSAELDGRGLADHLPPGVRDVLRHRVLSLPESSREAVAAAAVLGREVELARLSRLLEQPEDRTVDALVPVLDNGFLVEGGRSWAGGYAFPHELLREAVYREIPLPRRQRLHLRAVDALLEGPTADTDVMAAAVHVCEAGPVADPAQAAELVARAATLAAAAFGYEEAVSLAEARLPLLRRVAGQAEQADAEVSVARLRLRAGRGYDRVVELLEHALSIYLALGDTEEAGMVHSRLGGALAVPQPHMDVTRALDHFASAERLLAEPGTVFHLHRGRMSAAMHALDSRALGEAADRCAALAEASARPELRGASGWGRGWRELDLGRPDAALRELEDAFTSVRDLGDPLLGWPAANAAAMICTAYLLDPGSGRAWCRRGLGQPRFDALAHPHDALADQLALALAETGELDAARRAVDTLPTESVGRRLVAFLLGEWEHALEDWQSALDHDLAVGDLHDAVLNARWLSDAATALGDDARASATLQLALDIAATAPQVPSELWVRARLAGLQGTSEPDAVRHLARCDELLAAGGDWRGLAGEVSLSRALVAARTGDLARASDAATFAASTFLRYRLPWRQAAALHSWSLALAEAGEHDEAGARRREADAVLAGIGAPDRWRDLNATSTTDAHR